MQERTFEPLYRPDVASYPAVNSAVQAVADDWVSDGAQVDPDLMRAPGLNRNLAERETGKRMRPRDPRDRMARVLRPRRHLLTLHGVPANGRVDPSPRLDDAPDEGDVFLLDLAIVEL